MIDYKIIDNFLSKEVSDQIKLKMLSNEFPWYFQNEIAYPSEKNDQFYLNHLFYDAYYIRSAFWNEIVHPIISKINPKSLIRVKGNFYPNVNKFIENENHVDYPFNCLGAIYYVNTNDGYTILENSVKIESIQNRLLIFDASKLHRSTHCTDQKCRVNINFNYF
jgi:hypothetical protein